MTAIVIDEKTKTGKSLMNIVKTLQKTDKSIYISIDNEMENFLMRNPTKKNLKRKNPSDFAGTLSKKDSEDLLEYIVKSRKEWESGF